MRTALFCILIFTSGCCTKKECNEGWYGVFSIYCPKNFNPFSYYILKVDSSSFALVDSTDLRFYDLVTEYSSNYLFPEDLKAYTFLICNKVSLETDTLTNLNFISETKSAECNACFLTKDTYKQTTYSKIEYVLNGKKYFSNKIYLSK